MSTNGREDSTKRLIVSNTDELGGGQYERVGLEKPLLRSGNLIVSNTDEQERKITPVSKIMHHELPSPSASGASAVRT